MSRRKNNKVGAIQCHTCGAFTRSQKDSTCQRCNPSERTKKRLTRKLVKRILKSIPEHYCPYCGYETGNMRECVNEHCIAYIPF